MIYIKYLDSLSKKILTISLVLLAISLVVLSFIKIPSIINTKTTTINGFTVDYYDNDSTNGYFIVVDEPYNLHKLISLRESLYSSETSYFIITNGDSYKSSPQEDDLIISTINSLAHSYGLSIDQSIIIGYGSMGHYGLTEDFLGGIMVSPYKIPNNITMPDHPVLIHGVLSDNTATPQMLTHVYNMLSGDTINSIGFAYTASHRDVTLSLTSGAHNAYAPYNFEMVVGISDWASSIDGNAFSCDVDMRYNITVIATALSYLSFIAIMLILSGEIAGHYSNNNWSLLAVKVNNQVKFLTTRLFVWVMALPIMLALAIILWIVNLENLPVKLIFNIYLFGSGAVMLMLYRRGKMPGVEGAIDYRKAPPVIGQGKRISVVAIVFTVVFYLFFHYLGFYGIFPYHRTLITIFIYASLSFYSFYVFTWELTLLEDVYTNRYQKYLYMLTIYIPLVFMAIASVPMNQGASLFTAFVYILGLIFTLTLGIFLFSATGNYVFTALIQCGLFGTFLAITQL